MGNKPASLVIAAIISAILGAMATFAGIALLFIGEVAVISQLSSAITVSGAMIAGLGLMYFVWGVVDIAAAYGLWNLRQWGGTIALASAILAIIVSLILYSLLATSDIIINVLLIILIAIGWSNLK